MANYKNITMINAPETTVNVIGTADAILQASDWTQLTDSGLTSDCVASFKTYRESIRTIRRTNPSSPTWPNAPTEEWTS
jgi:hypothetical protein